MKRNVTFTCRVHYFRDFLLFSGHYFVLIYINKTMFTLAVFHIITVYNRFFLRFQPKYLHKNKVDRVLSLFHHCQFGFLSLYSPVIDRQTDTTESTEPKKKSFSVSRKNSYYVAQQGFSSIESHNKYVRTIK